MSYEIKVLRKTSDSHEGLENYDKFRVSAHSRKAISINNQTTYDDYEKHVLLFVRKDSDFLFAKQAFKKI